MIFEKHCDNIIGQQGLRTFKCEVDIMAWYEILIGALLVVASIIIIIIVLMQQSREAGLSGAIAGASETFFGKNKSRTMDAKLAKITKILATFFFIFTLLATFFLGFISSK